MQAKGSFHCFTPENYHSICDALAHGDTDLKHIIDAYGYPPMWTRPNTFETFVHIILEQQVSLASALATLNKLRERLGIITPEALLSLSDEALRACYFSRQKTSYARNLAEEIINGNISLSAYEQLSADEVRVSLCELKGIGNWTTDIYLMFVLNRADVFPAGDLAARNALKRIKALPVDTTVLQLEDIAARWKPYRTVATMLLWHYYLSHKKQKSVL